MVFCLQPLALRVTGAYAGGKARADFLKLAAGVVIAAFLGWVQARLFGRDVPELPNKAAYVYSALVVTALAWAFGPRSTARSPPAIARESCSGGCWLWVPGGSR